MKSEESFRTEKGGSCHVFPYQSDDQVGPARTVISVKEDTNMAVRNLQNNVNDYIAHGIKGPFWFVFKIF